MKSSAAISLFERPWAASSAFYLAVALLEHGDWLVSQGQANEAESVLGEARGIFDGLKARPWLERLAAAREGHARVLA